MLEAKFCKNNESLCKYYRGNDEEAVLVSTLTSMTRDTTLLREHPHI